MNLPQAVALLAFTLVVVAQAFTIFGITMCVRDGDVTEAVGFTGISRILAKVIVTIIACAIVLRVLA